MQPASEPRVEKSVKNANSVTPRSDAAVCPVCHALNMAGRKTCDLCGTKLMRENISESMESATSGDACQNCGRSLDSKAAVCPGCGRVRNIDRSEPVLPPPIIPTNDLGFSGSIPDPSTMGYAQQAPALLASPPHFRVETMADGRLYLSRTWGGRFSSEASGLLFALFAGLILMRFVPVNPAKQTPGGSLWMLLFLFGGVAAIALIYLFCYREAIIVGPGTLEKRMSLFGQTWTSQMVSPAVLRVETRETGAWSRSGPRIIRTLYAAHLGRSIPLDRGERRTGGILGLLNSSLDPIPEDTPAILGMYLAHHTGWPFVDPARNRF